jgi:hypothetical protein
MAAISGSDLSEEEQFRRRDAEERRREELIAQCMNEAGFEYIPNPTLGVQVYGGGGEGEWFDPDNREWVIQYGYGGVNYPQADSDANADYDAKGSAPEYVDPNRAYVESLSDSERQAWEWAMWGQPPEPENGIITAEMREQVDPGCYGRANDLILQESPASLLESEQFRPLFEALNQMRNEMWENEYTFAEVNRDWSDCMAGAGFPGFSHQSDANNQFWEEYSVFFTDWDWETQGDPHGTPGFTALGEREVQIALADVDCRIETNFTSRVNEISLAMETQFVADHRAELEALRAAAEQLRG